VCRHCHLSVVKHFLAVPLVHDVPVLGPGRGHAPIVHRHAVTSHKYAIVLAVVHLCLVRFALPSWHLFALRHQCIALLPALHFALCLHVDCVGTTYVWYTWLKFVVRPTPRAVHLTVLLRLA
jgi:hypothetical protein